MMQSFKETNNRSDKVSFCNLWGVLWSNTSNQKLIPNIFGNMSGFWACLNLNGEDRDYISATVYLVTLLTAMRTTMGIQCQEPHSSCLTGITHISLPPIKMLRAETLIKGLLSRAPGNRYNFIVETKGVMPLINRHLFQKISPGEVRSSHLPICTLLRPCWCYSSERLWATGLWFFTHYPRKDSNCTRR